jgi:hypothetical protein
MKMFIGPIIFGILVGLLVFISLAEFIVWPLWIVLTFHFLTGVLLAYLIFGRVTNK